MRESIKLSYKIGAKVDLINVVLDESLELRNGDVYGIIEGNVLTIKQKPSEIKK